MRLVFEQKLKLAFVIQEWHNDLHLVMYHRIAAAVVSLLAGRLPPQCMIACLTAHGRVSCTLAVIRAAQHLT